MVHGLGRSSQTNIDTVHIDALVHWMDVNGVGQGPLDGLRPLGGGTQNIMFALSRNGRDYVLRRGPRHLRPTTNDSLRREMRILTALADTTVPHPRLVAGCTDESVMGGSVFYLMDSVEGFNAAEMLPDLHAGDISIRRAMGSAMVDALAQLGSLDHHRLGLADYGRPEGFLDRQVPRWLRELRSYGEYPDYPPASLPGDETIAAWLERNAPNSWTAGIMHGDFHVANVMFEQAGPAVAAIVDWEMSTIGDPLLDLGWMIATWPSARYPNGIGVSALATAGDLATARELVERYAQRSDRDLNGVHWYVVLACFKLGVVLEGTFARACAGKADPEVGKHLHGLAVELFERAHAVIRGDEII